MLCSDKVYCTKYFVRGAVDYKKSRFVPNNSEFERLASDVFPVSVSLLRLPIMVILVNRV